MTSADKTEGRAGLYWLALLVIAGVALPWAKGAGLSEGFGQSALALGLAGQTWLLPVPLLTALLAGLALSRPGWLQAPAALALILAAMLVFLTQAFAIGLKGPSFAAISAVFPAAEQGQRGLGYGGFVTFFALLALLADALAARGFCRGERFASGAVVMVTALLVIFVFFPILKLGMAAFHPTGTDSVLAAFVTRLTASDLWGLGCLNGAGTRCGVVINTLVLGICAAFLSTLLGLALAMLVARSDFRFKRALRAISILPIITPPFVVGVAIIVLFGRSGVLTQFGADLFDIPATRWVYGLPGILMAQVLAFAPVTFLVLLGTIEAINPTLEEASTTLGARSATTFRKVTWPLLRPGLAAAFLLAFIESLSDFGNPLVLGGGYEVLSTKIYFAVVGARHDMSNAATLAMLLLALTLVAFWLQMRWLGRKSYVTVTGKSDAGAVSPLPRPVQIAVMAIVVPWVIFTLGIYAIVVAGGFVTNISRMDLTPTFAHLWTAFSFEISSQGLALYGSAWTSMITTLWVSGLAAPLTTLVGIIAAWLVARQDFFGKRAFEFGTMLSFAIPGTVVGVAYVVAFNVPPVDITGTLAILVIAFVFRNMSVGMRAGLAALAQIDRSMEEASQTMGAGGLATLRRIVLPLIRPAIFTSLVYAFVTAMTAVSAVIFLVTARYNMATAYIMGRVENGEYALAIAYSAVLMIVMVICVVVIQLIVGQRRVARRAEPQDRISRPVAAAE